MRRDAMRLYLAVGLSAMLGYGLLKTVWGLGSRVGVRDVGEWDRLFGELTPLQHWFALWGTVVLAVCGMALLVVVAESTVGPSSLRRQVRAVAWFVSAVLGLFSLIALGATLVAAVRPSDAAPLSLWVHILTYGSFLAYALSLAGLCRSTRSDFDAGTFK